MEPTTDEIRGLRQCVREVAALSVLSAAWGQTEPQGIAESLAEVLVRSLPHVEFVCVWVKGFSDAAFHEAVRTPQPPNPASCSQRISNAVASLLKEGTFGPSPIIANPVGEGTVQLAVIPIGYESDCGVLVAGSRLPAFPSQPDQLLLGVAANQAAIVLQHKRSVDGLRRQSKLLEDERELLRAAQERLQVQEEWLRVTLASIGDAVIATDTDGQITFLNSVAEQLTGWNRIDAEGQLLESVFTILNEQTQQPIENPVEKVLRDGVIVGLGNHTVLIAKDGTKRPIDDAAAPIRDAAGKLIGVVLTFRDVTEQRKAERELRTSEARKSAILETALDCIITMDHEGKVVEFNPAAERTLGYKREHVVGQELGELIIPPSLRERHRDGMARYLATGEGPVLGKRLELPALRADGTEFPIELAITRISADGLPLFTAYLRDITQQKRAEQQREVRLAVTYALSEAGSVRDGASGVLRAVCENLGWDVGFFWTINEEGSALVCRQSWHRQGVSVDEFEIASCARTFTKEEGLPGRVWATSKPAWILDVVQDTNFPRLATAAKYGLHSAFACPIVVGNETLGVIEFLTKRIQEPDAALLEMMTTVAGNVGQFIERKTAEEQVKQSEQELADFFEHATVGLHLVGPDGIILRANQAEQDGEATGGVGGGK